MLRNIVFSQVYDAVGDMLHPLVVEAYNGGTYRIYPYVTGYQANDQRFMLMAQMKEDARRRMYHKRLRMSSTLMNFASRMTMSHNGACNPALYIGLYDGVWNPVADLSHPIYSKLREDMQ